MSSSGSNIAFTNVRPGFNSGTFATNGVYSVWSWDKGLYDYYQADSKNRPGYGSEVKPPMVSNSLSGVLGEDPDQSGHRMPVNVKHIGSGSLAMGEVVAVVPPASRSPWIAVILALVIPTTLLWITTRLDTSRRFEDRNSLEP